jgi:zinc transporter
MSDVIRHTEDAVDNLEEVGQRLADQTFRRRLGQVRRRIVKLRRYLSPQRDALAQLAKLDAGWFTGRHRERLVDVTNQVIRYVEDLDAVRERAGFLQDEFDSRIAEGINRNMYHLSILAAVFLPLGLITSLFSMDIGGIPGALTSWPFWAVCGGLGALVGTQVLVFRKLKWF